MYQHGFCSSCGKQLYMKHTRWAKPRRAVEMVGGDIILRGKRRLCPKCSDMIGEYYSTKDIKDHV